MLRTYPQFPDIFWVSDALLNKNDNEIKSRFQKIYSSFAETVEKYLIQLSSRYPNIHEKQFSYTWTVEVGRDHYYTQIVRDLIDKVGLGFYKKNEFLPSEAQLAKQYKVSISTIKKSLSVLNELCYGETINGKGTKIYIQNDQYTIKSLNNKKYRKDTRDINIDVALLGQRNISLAVNRDGYLQANIFDTAKSFYLGRDKIEEFINYVLENGILLDKQNKSEYSSFDPDQSASVQNFKKAAE